ncbi:MAG: UPF0104 family protein [Gemmatimonadetes bacterium]|nr:MAG: UPF0104 family protein [Gemmatimonadota bacterium]
MEQPIDVRQWVVFYEANMPEPILWRPEPRLLKKGIFLFSLIALIASIGVFWWKTPHLADIIRHLQLPFLGLALLSTAIEWFFSSLKLYLFVVLHNEKISLWTCFRTITINYFVSATTPSSIGGGVAQTYVLHKEGVHASHAFAILIISFSSTVFFLTVATAGSLALQPAILNISPKFLPVLYFSIAGVILVLTAITAVLFHPQPFQHGLRLIFQVLSHLSRRDWLADRAPGQRLLHQFNRFQQEFVRLLREETGLVLFSLVLVALALTARFATAYFLIRGFGVEVHFGDVWILQTLLFFSTYLIPTPGSSGAAEIASVALMGLIVPAEVLGLFTVIWRVVTTYLAVILGGFFFLTYLREN